MRLVTLFLSLCVLFSLGACVGTTGGDIFTFQAAAAGPADAIPNQPLVFDTPAGFHVTLTSARVHMGGVYLNRSVPTAGLFTPSCFLPGIYIAEVTTGLDVDVLSPEPQPFPVEGEATADEARTAEVWLTGGDVSAADDPTVLVQVAGVAERGAERYPFEGQVTIGANRVQSPPNAAQPGAKPLCKQRIVSPILVDLHLARGGSLLVRVDPRGFFTTVDFSELEKVSDSPLLYRFLDQTEGQPNINFYTNGVRATAGVYSFEWTQP